MRSSDSSAVDTSIVLRFPHHKDHLRKIVVDDGEGEYEVYRLAPNVANWPAADIPDEVNPRSHDEQCLKGKVAKDIENTLRQVPQDFWLANRGGYVLADQVRFDPKKQTVEIVLSDLDLHGIADGATTNAVIAKLQKEWLKDEDPDLGEALATARFNVDVVVGITDRERIGMLVQGRNRSVQVKEWSLADFKGQFDWVKEYVDRKDGPFRDRIGWEENSGKEVSILDLLSLMTLFHPVYDDPSDRRRKAPTVAFSSKGTAHARFVDEKLAPGYKSLKPVLEDIIRLWEHIHANFEDTYEKWNEETNGKGSKLGRRKGVRSLKNAEQLPLTGIETEYKVEKGILFPLLASLRTLLSRDEGNSLSWTTEPIPFFDQFGTDLMDVLMNLYIDAASKNPATLGKMKLAYTTLHDRSRNLLRESLGVATP